MCCFSLAKETGHLLEIRSISSSLNDNHQLASEGFAKGSDVVFDGS